MQACMRQQTQRAAVNGQSALHNNYSITPTAAERKYAHRFNKNRQSNQTAAEPHNTSESTNRALCLQLLRFILETSNRHVTTSS